MPSQCQASRFSGDSSVTAIFDSCLVQVVVRHLPGGRRPAGAASDRLRCLQLAPKLCRCWPASFSYFLLCRRFCVGQFAGLGVQRRLLRLDLHAGGAQLLSLCIGAGQRGLFPGLSAVALASAASGVPTARRRSARPPGVLFPAVLRSEAGAGFSAPARLLLGLRLDPQLSLGQLDTGGLCRLLLALDGLSLPLDLGGTLPGSGSGRAVALGGQCCNLLGRASRSGLRASPVAASSAPSAWPGRVRPEPRRGRRLPPWPAPSKGVHQLCRQLALPPAPAGERPPCRQMPVHCVRAAGTAQRLAHGVDSGCGQR